MKVKHIDELEVFYTEPGIIAKKISENPAFEIVWLRLEAGAYLKPHITPFNVQFLVKEGLPTFEIGGDVYQATEDQIIECRGDIPHGINNSTDSEIIVLVIKHLNINI